MRRFFLLLLCLLSLPVVSAAVKESSVYFIGNSYTFYNNLPTVVQAMAESRKIRLKVDASLQGAMDLRGFYTDPNHEKARRAAASGKYRWVVLQDQSQTPANIPDRTKEYVQKWCALAAQGKSRPLLFITWPHAAKEGGKLIPMADMQQKTDTTYCEAAVADKARVAPVSEAWRRWHKKYPETTLYVSDGSHPNKLGTYLAACVFYAVICEDSPIGLPSRLVMKKDGKKLLVLQVPSKHAENCQKIAADVVEQFTAQGYLDKKAARNSTLPDADTVRAKLKDGVTYKELRSLIGAPVYTRKESGESFYQFTLRDNAEFCIYCTPAGKVLRATIARPGSPCDIINVAEE